MRTYGKFGVCLCICVAMLLCVACGREPMATADILRELEAEAESLPAGERYTSTAEEGSDGYCSADLRRSLYGEDAEEIFETVEEYAIYLSSAAKPYEIAVFRCYSATDAHRVALMCMERAELLRVALHGTDWETFADGATVLCRGHYVVLSLTDEPRAVEERAKRLLR